MIEALTTRHYENVGVTIPLDALCLNNKNKTKHLALRLTKDGSISVRCGSFIGLRTFDEIYRILNEGVFGNGSKIDTRNVTDT